MVERTSKNIGSDAEAGRTESTDAIPANGSAHPSASDGEFPDKPSREATRDGDQRAAENGIEDAMENPQNPLPTSSEAVISKRMKVEQLPPAADPSTDSTDSQDGTHKPEKADAAKAGTAGDNKTSASIPGDLPFAAPGSFLSSPGMPVIPGASSKNIFTQTGPERTKKDSGFLKPSFIESTKAQKRTGTKALFSRMGSVYYLEDDEWIPFADGEILLADGKFIFIREGLRMVLLSFKYSSDTFSEKEDALHFTASGRKSTDTGVEIVDRQYKVCFDTPSAQDEFLRIVCSA